MGKTRESANLVSDNLIFADIVNNRVGIGTTIPTTSLDISGDVNIVGVITAQNGALVSQDEAIAYSIALG
jgi:hypothetical protein